MHRNDYFTKVEKEEKSDQSETRNHDDDYHNSFKGLERKPTRWVFNFYFNRQVNSSGFFLSKLVKEVVGQKT